MSESETTAYKNILFEIHCCLTVVGRRYGSSKTTRGTVFDIDTKGDRSVHSEISRAIQTPRVRWKHQAVNPRSDSSSFLASGEKKAVDRRCSSLCAPGRTSDVDQRPGGLSVLPPGVLWLAIGPALASSKDRRLTRVTDAMMH